MAAGKDVRRVTSGARRLRRRTRLNRGAVDVRALFRDREFIKITSYLLPREAKRQVLQLMERLRQARMVDRRGRPSGQAAPLPEMTPGEMVREINWRVGTLPPGDAEALARYIRRLTRWRAQRRLRAARTRVQQGGAFAPTPP